VKMWLEIYLIGLGVTLIVNLCYERWTSVVRDCSPQKTSHESWTSYSLSEWLVVVTFMRENL